MGASSVAGPHYISPKFLLPGVRGRMTALFQFNVIFGILLAYISNNLLKNTGDEPWRWMLGVEGIPINYFLLLAFYYTKEPTLFGENK